MPPPADLISRLNKETEWTLNEDGGWEDRNVRPEYYNPPRVPRRQRLNKRQKEIAREIDRKNQAILNKLATIRHRGSDYSQKKMMKNNAGVRANANHRGMHYVQRKREWDKIHNENQAIMRRLNGVKPTLDQEQIGLHHGSQHDDGSSCHDGIDQYGEEYDDDDYDDDDPQRRVGVSASAPPEIGHRGVALPQVRQAQRAQSEAPGRAFQGLRYGRGGYRA